MDLSLVLKIWQKQNPGFSFLLTIQGGPEHLGKMWK